MSAAAANAMDETTSPSNNPAMMKDEEGNAEKGTGDESVGMKAEDVEMENVDEPTATTTTTIQVSPIVVAVTDNQTAASAEVKEDEEDETPAMTTAETQATTTAETQATTVTETQAITTAAADPSPSPAKVAEDDGGVGVLSEEQTNAALAQSTTATETPAITTAAADPIPSPAKVAENDGGVGVLSEEQTNAALAALQEEEQTNAALAALQEASSIVIEAKEAEEAKANEKKRKATDTPEKGPAKKRGPPVRVAWNDRMEMLRKYREEFGNLLIPIRYKLNPSLGKFVHNTREQYKLFHKKTPLSYKKKCSLTAERIQQLEDLGFVWCTERTKRQNEDWESRLIQLNQYKEKNGDCLVPHGYDADPSFAEWIHRQRTAYASMEKEEKINPLVKERMDKLMVLGFNFTVHSDKWLDHWKMLKEYKDKHGHVQVPTHYADNPKLGRWVHTQRHQRRLQQKAKKSCMTQERVDLLDQLEFSWEVRPSLERPRATWQQRLDELKDFHAIHQHFRVPPGTHPQLHSWCQEQKHRLRNVEKVGKDVSRRMGPERVNELQVMGFSKDIELALSKEAGDADPASMDTAGAEPMETEATKTNDDAEATNTNDDAEDSKTEDDAAAAVKPSDDSEPFKTNDDAEPVSADDDAEHVEIKDETTETATTEEEVALAVEEVVMAVGEDAPVNPPIQPDHSAIASVEEVAQEVALAVEEVVDTMEV